MCCVTASAIHNCPGAVEGKWPAMDASFDAVDSLEPYWVMALVVAMLVGMEKIMQSW